MYTNDMGKWQDMEHEFAGFMTEKVTPKNDWDVVEFLDEYYTWILEYGRGLEQEDYVQWVQAYAPELLKMVEV